MTDEELEERGLEGRNWVNSDESGMSARMMGKNFIKAVDKTFSKFTPRPKLDLIKIKNIEPNKL